MMRCCWGGYGGVGRFCSTYKRFFEENLTLSLYSYCSPYYTKAALFLNPVHVPHPRLAALMETTTGLWELGGIPNLYSML